jgi:hypothetical protein
MRTLKFIVNNQVIENDPSCDFSGLVPGTEGHLQAEFSFSKEWNKSVKVVEFIGRSDKDCNPQVLKDGKTCIIPAEVLKRRAFGIRVVGKKDELKLTTNKLIVCQKGV